MSKKKESKVDLNFQIFKSTVTEMPRDDYGREFVYNAEALREVDDKMVAEFRKEQVDFLEATRTCLRGWMPASRISR